VDELVLKMLRIERDYTPEFYELHRRDAIALERLSSSRFVVNVYGYCGQSTINERANFPTPGIKSLEDFNRRMRDQPPSTTIDMMKLQIAASVASGLNDVHQVVAIDMENNTTNSNSEASSSSLLLLSSRRVSMVHYDMNPRNVALFRGGKPKLNDFNIAEFLRINIQTNQSCGFRSRMHEPWWRAPEEMDIHPTSHHWIDEKVDVYALGNILFHILTTYAPRGKMKRERMEMVRAIVASGKPPILPKPYSNDPNPIYEAFRQAMALCFVADPQQRGTAAEVSAILLDALVMHKTHAIPQPPTLKQISSDYGNS
jgi:serine/threonine protein kinase